MININLKDDKFCDLALLQKVQADPDVSQAKLAEDLGVAVGTVNWHLKRLVEKGYIKVKRARRRKLRYIITPDGLSLRARLTLAYVQHSFMLFRQVQQHVRQLLNDLKKADIRTVRLVGDGDIADVCRLTCMEQHFILTENILAPALVVNGLDVELVINDNQKHIKKRYDEQGI